MGQPLNKDNFDGNTVDYQNWKSTVKKEILLSKQDIKDENVEDFETGMANFARKHGITK